MGAIAYKSIEEMRGSHYDVCIGGVWYGENYGSTLTYFALQRAIRDMGYSAIMQEKPSRSTDPEMNWGIHSRVFAMEHYQAIAPPLPLQELSSLNEYCDRFVMGSDQLWNYGIARGFGKSFYLDYVADDKPKISYGTSFGHGTSFTPIESLSDVTYYMQRFDAVSVREESAVRVLHDEFGIEGMQVLDPVFLLDASVYHELAAGKERPESPYLLAYVLDPSPEIGEALKTLAEKKGLELVVLADARGTTEAGNDVDQTRETLGVENCHVCADAPTWLAYLEGADFVVTDSFHGACFTLIFERPLIALCNQRRGKARINSLRDLLKLWDNVVDDADSLMAAIESDSQIDYGAVKSILQGERTRSSSWLKQALEIQKVPVEDVSCVKKRECCGCGACYNACPFDAIAMQPDAEGFLYPVVDRNLCRSCGICKRTCPSINPKLEKWKTPVVLAGFTTDEVRDISSSGGIFSLVAEKVLDEGGVVCGAAFDDAFSLKHVIISSKDELGPLRMSKYMQSDAGKTYSEIKHHLEQGRRALYVGCPCQIAGLNSYLGKDYDNLITIDLLCHGGPSQKVFKKYLREVHGGKTVEYVGFRDKDVFGWSTEMTVKYADSDPYRVKRNKDLFYRAFLPCFSVRPHCQVCNYARLPRQGDLTLGDFWGVAKYDEAYTDGKGTSIIVVNSPKGLHLVSDLEPKLDTLGGINLQYVLEHGQPLARPFKNNPLRNRFFRLAEDLPLKKAVSCCERNVFDVGLVGLTGETPFKILGAYAVYKSLVADGCSVLVARYPLDLYQGTQKCNHRLLEFSYRHFAKMSVHYLEARYHMLNGTCADFVLINDLPASVMGFVKKKAVLDYKSATMLNPLLLVDGDAYRAIAADNVDESSARYGYFISGNAAQGKSVIDHMAEAGEHAIDLAADMQVERLVLLLDTLQTVVTDDADCMALCLTLDTPVLYVGGEDTVVWARQCGADDFILRDGEDFAQAMARVSALKPRDVLDSVRIGEERALLQKSLQNARASARAPEEGVKPKQKKGSIVTRGAKYVRKHGIKKAFLRGMKLFKQ